MRKMLKEEYSKERILDALDELYKNGFCDINSMPRFLFNDYRELKPQQLVYYVNEWIETRKIKHPKLVLKEKLYERNN